MGGLADLLGLDDDAVSDLSFTPRGLASIVPPLAFV
jgi:hypothetical protein